MAAVVLTIAGPAARRTAGGLLVRLTRSCLVAESGAADSDGGDFVSKWMIGGGVLLAAVAMVIALWAMGVFSRAQPLAAPDGVELVPLRSIAPWEAWVLLRLAGVEGMPVAHTVDCYRMIYTAPGRGGESVRLSGLLALPRDVRARRLVSFQHGTSTTRTAVPSAPDGTGIATAIAFAGNGYALVVPDYPGLGLSEGRHPYYVAEAIAPSVTAMIAAAKRVPGVPDAPVFLSGFSQGGWASVAALSDLERDGVAVLAAAPVAGAYDLRHVSLPAALHGGAASHSLYLAYAAWGQADYYGHALDSLLTPHYAALVERLFAGATPEEIRAALPADPRAMFNAAFLDAFDHGGSHWFLETFAANSLTGVTPRAPVRMYFGSKDLDVVPDEALKAAQAMQGRGADVVAVDVGPVGHDASMLAAAPLILAWLREREAAALAAKGP
jgi:hypothetical protein